LNYAIIPDITVPGTSDNALGLDVPYDIVMHTASLFLFSVASSARDFLGPAIKGTAEMLEGVQRVAKDTVNCVSSTSSYVAVGTFGPGGTPEEAWNPVTTEQAEAASAKGIKGLAYLASRMYAEPAAWDFREMHRGCTMGFVVSRSADGTWSFGQSCNKDEGPERKSRTHMQKLIGG
jgi:nucleoside-diphosphate-sugar epimerase